MRYEESMREMLERVSSGELDIDTAMERLRSLPFSDLGFAKVDHHRELRQGFAEVVFCERKTDEQVKGIVQALLDENRGNILLTRASPAVYEAVKAVDGSAVYHAEAKAITIERQEVEPYGLISIVSAGTSDMPVAEEARVTASIMGSRVENFYDVGVAGSRTSTTSGSRVPTGSSATRTRSSARTQWSSSPAWRARSPAWSVASSPAPCSPCRRAWATVPASAGWPHCWR